MEITRATLQEAAAVLGVSRKIILDNLYRRLIFAHNDFTAGAEQLIVGTGLNLLSGIQTTAGPGVDTVGFQVTVAMGYTLTTTSYGAMITYLYDNASGPPTILSRAVDSFVVRLPIATANVQIVLGWVVVY